MYSKGSAQFKHCHIQNNYARNVKYIGIILSKSLGSKRYSFGRDNQENHQKAIRAGLEIDLYCEECLVRDEAINLDRIGDIVSLIKKPHLKIVRTVSIVKIWDEYVEWHKSLGCWGEVYQKTHIANLTSFVRYPDFPDTIDRPSEVLQWFLNGKRSVKTARDRFKLLVASVDWASKNDRLERKVGLKWRDCLSSLNGKLKSERKTNQQKASQSEESNIDPFSLSELEKILEALEKETFSRYKGRHYQYYHYIKFLWLTGCRPSEAIALKWDNVDFKKKRIKFCEGEVQASGEIVKKKGTKTVPYRLFPINGDLLQLLSSLPTDTERVFNNYQGKAISQHALNRIWQGLLPKLGIKYRIPYQLRHTMISYHANRGFPIVQLANIVGNSEKTISDHYLKIDISMINVPKIDID